LVLPTARVLAGWFGARYHSRHHVRVSTGGCVHCVPDRRKVGGMDGAMDSQMMDLSAVKAGLACSRGHILLVDDDEGCCITLGQILRKAGFDVTSATGFQSALEVLEGEQPVDLLVTDLVMPSGVNGIALSRMARLRRHNIKVVYVTGYDVPGAAREALGPILRKPVDGAQLIEQVEQALAAV
jgi:CheY-like chemotaxis protein